MCAWRPDDDVGCLPQCPPYFFEALSLSLTELGVHYFGWTGWPASHRDLSFHIPHLGLYEHVAMTGDARNPKSGPHSCETGAY